jgi:hypothetical protein
MFRLYGSSDLFHVIIPHEKLSDEGFLFFFFFLYGTTDQCDPPDLPFIRFRNLIIGI